MKKRFLIIGFALVLVVFAVFGITKILSGEKDVVFDTRPYVIVNSTKYFISYDPQDNQLPSDFYEVGRVSEENPLSWQDFSTNSVAKGSTVYANNEDSDTVFVCINGSNVRFVAEKLMLTLLRYNGNVYIKKDASEFFENLCNTKVEIKPFSDSYKFVGQLSLTDACTVPKYELQTNNEAYFTGKLYALEETPECVYVKTYKFGAYHTDVFILADSLGVEY